MSMTHSQWHYGFFGAMTLGLGLGLACDLGPTARSGDAGPGSEAEDEACGELAVGLIAGQTHEVGEVVASVDSDQICVTFTTIGAWYLVATHLAIASDPEAIPQQQGNPIPGLFPYHHEDLWTQEDLFCVSLEAAGVAPGDPIYIAAHAEVAELVDGEVVDEETAWGAGNEFPGSSWGMYFEVEPGECDRGACGLRTQTQGGWGTACKGDNPGCYRDSHFDEAFPEGLTVGCDNLEARLLSGAAVERALPTGGAPRGLLASEAGDYDGSANDPKVGTVLFGQVVALALNLAFDGLEGFKIVQDDPPPALGELVIVDPASPCLGMTVAAVLDAANHALGGCATELSAGELSDCAALINESFVDGEDEGAPICSDRLGLPSR